MQQYLDPRILRIFVLGIASGFPWVLIGSMLTLWLQESGLSRASIGYAGAIYAAYSINFIWSPLLDRIKKPFGLNFGQRKSWIVLTQIFMAIACFLVSRTDPSNNANLTILFCLAIAITSATQDIAIDAFRIDSIPEKETELMSIGASAAIAGWHTGFSGLGALILFLSNDLITNWSLLYLSALPLFILLIIFTLLLPEPPSVERTQNQKLIETTYLQQAVQRKPSFNALTLLVIVAPFFFAIWTLSGGVGIPDYITQSGVYVPASLVVGFLLLIAGMAMLNSRATYNHTNIDGMHSNTSYTYLQQSIAWLSASVIHPLLIFIKQNGGKAALTILTFVVLFKIGEAFLGRMSLVFYKEIGFSNEDIAIYSKLVGWGVTVLFSILGGLFTIRFGVIRGLFVAGIAMAASNLMFSLMAYTGPEEWLFAITVIVDGFTSAWSNVAFVAFLSSLCNRAYTATQYALLASLGTLGRTLFASSSGQLVDLLKGDWAVFFMLTALLVIPSLILLIRLAKLYRTT